MLKTIKYLFILVVIALIGACVYIATLPGKFEHHYITSFKKVPKQFVFDKILKFENWKDWAIVDTSRYKVYASADPLQSKLETSMVNAQQLSLIHI